METIEYLYKIQPTRPEMLKLGATNDENQIIAQHYSYLKRLCDEGIVILAGRTLNTDPSSFGIVIFRAEDEQTAHEIVDADPGVKNGVMMATLYPYRIALMSDK